MDSTAASATPTSAGVGLVTPCCARLALASMPTKFWPVLAATVGEVGASGMSPASGSAKAAVLANRATQSKGRIAHWIGDGRAMALSSGVQSICMVTGSRPAWPSLCDHL
jgi:hypothetical protein